MNLPNEVMNLAAVVVPLIGLLVWFWKSIIPWLKGRIDAKNGQIERLVATTEGLVAQNHQTMENARVLTETIVGMVGQTCEAQAAFLGELRDEHGKLREALCGLTRRLEEALARGE